jgi:hypothetical protein
LPTEAVREVSTGESKHPAKSRQLNVRLNVEEKCMRADLPCTGNPDCAAKVITLFQNAKGQCSIIRVREQRGSDHTPDPT